MAFVTSTFLRGAKLAALPAAYAGRKTLGVAMKVGGAPAEHLKTELERKTVEQLCRTLGELKGGALKLGQAMSVFEAVLPEALAGPYRNTLNALQHAAPPLPRSAVERVLVESIGADWQDLLTIDWVPAGAASIGQVHKGVWCDGTVVAVKIQYPGVGKALMSDLRQLRRAARLFGVLAHGVDALGLLDELSARLVEELDYTLEAENQAAYREAFEGDPLVYVPEVVHATETVLVTEWLDGELLSSRIHDETLTQAERDAIGVRLVHAIYAGPTRAGLMHGDPHPGNFMLLSDGRLGVLDFGCVKTMPGGIPHDLGVNAGMITEGLEDGLRDQMVRAGLLPVDAPVTTADLVDYLGAMAEPFREDTFMFTRAWLRAEAVKLANPKSSTHTAARHLTLPAQWLIVHRVASGVVAMLCQLGANVPMRAMEIRWSPGFREVVSRASGTSEADLLTAAESSYTNFTAGPVV